MWQHFLSIQFQIEYDQTQPAVAMFTSPEKLLFPRQLIPFHVLPKHWHLPFENRASF